MQVAFVVYWREEEGLKCHENTLKILANCGFYKDLPHACVPWMLMPFLEKWKCERFTWGNIGKSWVVTKKMSLRIHDFPNLNHQFNQRRGNTLNRGDCRQSNHNGRLDGHSMDATLLMVLTSKASTLLSKYMYALFLPRLKLVISPSQPLQSIFF